MPRRRRAFARNTRTRAGNGRARARETMIMDIVRCRVLAPFSRAMRCASRAVYSRITVCRSVTTIARFPRARESITVGAFKLPHSFSRARATARCNAVSVVCETIRASEQPMEDAKGDITYSSEKTSALASRYFLTREESSPHFVLLS